MNDQADTKTSPMDAAEAMTRFWTEMATRMAAESFASPPGTPQFARRMQDVFFDVMGRQADEFMRSEAFLSAMKQSMDASLAFRQQLNDLLSKTVQQFQMPTGEDVADVAELVRQLGRRVEDSMAALNDRIGRLERRIDSGGVGSGAAGEGSSKSGVGSQQGKGSDKGRKRTG